MKLKLLLLTFIIFLITGCASYTELNNLSIVNSLGIDYQNGKYVLSVSVVEGKIDDQDIEKSITIYHSSQSSLDEAFQDIYLASSKKLYLSHIDLLVLSKNAIDNKLKEIIDTFINNNDYRNNFNVVVLKDISIMDFFDKNILSEDINNLIRTNELETAMSRIKDFETITEELLIDKCSYLPTISFSNDKVKISGFTMIKDFKCYEEIDLNQNILLNILTNDNSNNTFINNTKVTQKQVRIKTDKNNINIFIEMTINNHNNNFNNSLENDIYAFLTNYQEKNYDILKIQEMIRKNDYKYYKNNYDNLLDKVNYEIEIKTEVKEDYIEGDDFYE